MEPLNQQFREMLEQMGNPAFDGLADELEGGEAVTGVRLNPAKEGEKTDVATMEGGEKVGWCESGRILRERPQFTLDPQLHQGRYYVQDPSSMILSQIAEALANKAAPTDGRPLRYLDACAAPGGKTTAAVSALPEDAFVVANEYDFRRAEILKENVIKWGSGNVTVTRGDTARMRKLPGFFDIVAADVP